MSLEEDICLEKRTKSFWRPLVVAFNYIYGITGILIIALGIWMRFTIKKVEDLVIKDSKSVDLSVYLAIFGVIILLISILSSKCIDKPIHMFVYSSTLLTLAVLNLTFGELLLEYRGRISNEYQKGVLYHMSSYAMDESKSSVMDRIQIELKCCGSSEPFDWFRTKVEQIPPSCCKQKLCDPSNIEEIYAEGCFTKVYNLLDVNTSVIDLFVFAIALVPMVGAMVVFMLAYETFNNQYQRIDCQPDHCQLDQCKQDLQNQTAPPASNKGQQQI